MKLKKNVKKKIIFGLGVLLVILLSLVLYKLIFSKSHNKKIKVISNIKEYNYELKNNKSTSYKKRFKELEKILNEKPVNYEKYASKIAEMFVIDFYSLKDKRVKTDIGGKELVIPQIEENFIENAQNTYYKNLQSNIYGNRTQNLPEVSKVEIKNVKKESYAYPGKTYEEAYTVDVEWNYKEGFDKYQKKATITLVKEGKKLHIVELKK